MKGTDGNRDASVSGIGKRRLAAKKKPAAGYDRRRREIIAASAEIFKRKGYSETNLADVAEATGTDRATLYYYVGSKEELLDEVVTEAVIDNLAVAESIRASSDPAPEKLRQFVTLLMTSFGERYPIYYVYLQENLAHVVGRRRVWAKKMRKVNQQWEAAVEGIVQDGIDDGSLRPIIDAQTMAYGIMGMVNWTNRWFNPAVSNTSANAIGAAFAEILLNGIAAENPERQSISSERGKT